MLAQRSRPATRSSPYLDALKERVVVFDGAMGTSIQALELSAADFGGLEGANDYLVITRPDVIETIHRSFLAAGADVIETNTFGGNRLKLAEYGLGDRVYEVNFRAAQLARRVADEFATPERPRFVAGSLGPTGMLPSSDDPSLSAITFDELADIFYEQARALIEGGCDLLLVETVQDLLEAKAAVVGIGRYFRDSGRWVPLQVQVTLDTNGRMLLGTDIGAALTTLEALPVDVIGLNCSTGPDYMREPVRYLAEFSSRPISVIPNAGLPINVNGRACYPMEPAPLAETLIEFAREFGVNAIGGCCGTTPEHIRLLAELAAGIRPKPRRARPVPAIASAIKSVPLDQEPRPLLIGERVNTQGSRRVKRLVLAEDYDGLLTIAREQVEGGAHALDLCVAVTERSDEEQQMVAAVRKLQMGVDAPLMIDTTEANVVEAALKHYPGRAIVNSINLENGRARLDAVLPLVREYGAAVVALTIDEEGMAKTAERKLAIARRIYQIATEEYEIPPEWLIFDPLTFTLATGEEEFRRSAIATLEGIRAIKTSLPGAYTSLGISNVSFGLKAAARAVLNSVFLYHAVQHGLDLAMVHPAEVTPYAEIPPEERDLADDLIFDRRPDALARFIAHFEHAVPAAAASTSDPTAGMSAEERIHWQILHRKKEGIEALIDEALTRRSPVAVLNDILLPAMKDVGDKFGAGELILPFVLQSAEVMKRAVAHLEQYLEKKEGVSKGKVVLATVYGDVHDIGKNLVDTILTNNGYTVYNLGKQVPVNTIIDRAVEVGADAIGLSALLVSTSKQMPLTVNELHRRGLKIPVLIGGASINRAFGRRILTLEDGTKYEAGVFYCKDAFEGLEVMDQLMDPERRPALLEQIHREAALADGRAGTVGLAGPAVLRPDLPRSSVRPLDQPPTPPFWGYRVVRSVPLAEVWPLLDLNTLFRLHWGGAKAKGAAWDRLIAEEFQPLLATLQQRAETEGWLAPAVIYGYYPCQADGQQVIVYDPADWSRELGRFTFPRQPDERHLCLADYLAERESGRYDVLPLQIVTAGRRASDYINHLQQAGNYSDMLYIHGLSVQVAEGLAEWTHRRIKAELGLGPETGRRYSWGYPACPDLAEQEILFRILPGSEIGVSLTPAHQLDPEQSTAALVIHHPDAIYFAIRDGR
ncbi:MAG: methionine synthase [Dehalococcoidia bacterium]|nr:methionine synthase [Dehalococcoidia bacterium]